MASTRVYTETELREEIAKGDAEAFHFLFNQYWNKVYSTALVLLKSPQFAEDIAQEAFLRIWRSREKIREIQDLDAFLFVVTRNLSLSRLTKIKREDAYRRYQLIHSATGNPGSHDQVAANELAAYIENGLRRLPPQQQRAFRLSRERGLSHEEIALEMGIGKDTVKNYIVLAIAFMRKYLKEYTAILLVATQILNNFL